MTAWTTTQLTQCHEKGVTLNTAWVRYAHPDLLPQWKALQKQSPLEALTRGAEAAAATDGDMLAKLSQALSGPSQIASERAALEKRLKTNIHSYIKQGHLHGFGFESPRRLASVPVAIPKEAWAGRCDWQACTLSFQGLEFVDVRLTTNRLRNEVLERGHVDPTPTNRAGRPSTGKEVTDAFHALVNAGEFDPTNSLTSHYPKVRQWLELHRPHMQPSAKFVSDKTLHRHLSHLFNNLKKTSRL